MPQGVMRQPAKPRDGNSCNGCSVPHVGMARAASAAAAAAATRIAAMRSKRDPAADGDELVTASAAADASGDNDWGCGGGIAGLGTARGVTDGGGSAGRGIAGTPVA